MSNTEKDHSSDGEIDTSKEENGDSHHEKKAIQVKDINGIQSQREFVPPSQHEKSALIRKLDWHLIPIVWVLYMLSVLDRANLGNARLAGLEDGMRHFPCRDVHSS